MTQAARRLYQPPGQKLTLSQVVQLNKRFLEAYLHFRNEPRVRSLEEKILRYNRVLRHLGLRDHQVGELLICERIILKYAQPLKVSGAKPTSRKTFGLLCYRLALLFFWSILPGALAARPSTANSIMQLASGMHGGVASAYKPTKVIKTSFRVRLQLTVCRRPQCLPSDSPLVDFLRRRHWLYNRKPTMDAPHGIHYNLRRTG